MKKRWEYFSDAIFVTPPRTGDEIEFTVTDGTEHKGILVGKIREGDFARTYIIDEEIEEPEKVYSEPESGG